MNKVFRYKQRGHFS